MIKSYKLFWERAFDWTGTSSRSEYWCPFLINAFVTVALFMGSNIVNFDILGPLSDAYRFADGLEATRLANEIAHLPFTNPVLLTTRYLGIFWALVTLVPLVTVMARRLRSVKFSSEFAFFYGVLIVIYQILQIFPDTGIDRVITIRMLIDILFNLLIFGYFIAVAVVLCALPERSDGR